MNKTMILAVLAATLAMPLAFATPVGDCDSKGAPSLGIVTLETPAGTFYIDDRSYVLGNGVWIYQESNGMSGLQRGGSSPIVPDDNEICVDSEGAEAGPDTLLV